MHMFGELRSLLQQKPSPEAWEQLCHFISEWSAEGFEHDTLPYVQSHLASWPAELRTTPLRWREGLARGANLPFASIVRVLDAQRMNLRNEDMLTMGRAPVMEHLIGLNLSDNKIGWRGLNHLLEHAPPNKLEALALDRTGIGNEGLKLLARSPTLSNLRVLSLSGVHMAPSGLEALMQSEHLGALEALVLDDNNLNDRHLASFASSRNFGNLRSLFMANNPLRAHDTIRIFRRTNISGVKVLDLSGCTLTESVSTIITTHTGLRGLEILLFARNPALANLRAFARTRALPNLRCLDAWGNGVNPDHLTELITGGALPKLEQLALKGSPSVELANAAQAHGVTLTEQITLSLGLLGERRLRSDSYTPH